MNEQLRTRWPQLLEQIMRDLNPLHPAMLGKFRAPYYWSVYRAEWASDVMFKRPSDLASIYEPFRQALAAMLAAADATTAQLACLAARPTASSLRSTASKKIGLSHDDSRC